MRKALLFGGIAGLLYVAYRTWKQASATGAAGEAFQNWAISPVGIGSVAALVYLGVTRR